MTTPTIRPDLASWAEFLSVWLVGSLALIALAAGLAQWSRGAAVRVAIWRVAFVLLLILPAAELFGLPRLLTDSLRTPTPSRSDLQVTVLSPAPGAGQSLQVVTLSAVPIAPAAWPAVVWGVGAALILGRLAVGQVLLGWLRRRLPLANRAIRERATAVARRCGYRGPVRVVSSAGVRSPYVFGLVRPLLAVPTDFAEEFTPAQQEAILAHEFGHLLNRDPLWHLIATLAVAVGWWNPLVWWARRRHEEAAEVAADEATLRVEDGPRLLAECLVLLGQRLTGRVVSGSLAAGGRRSNLARRVHRLLDLDAEATSAARRRLTGVLVAAALIAAVLVTTATARSDAPGRASLVGQAWDVVAHAEPVAVQPVGPPPAPRARTKVGAAPVNVVLVRPPEKRSDEAIMASFNLSDEKMNQFRALRDELDVETQKMYALPWQTQRVARGLEINKKWRAGLHRLLTPEQYRAYAEYWRDPPTVAVPPVPGQPAVPSARSPVAAGG